MTTARQALARAIDARRDAFFSTLKQVMAQGPQAQPGPEIADHEIRQMVDGFAAIVAETVGERGDAARRMYLDTVIPGVIAIGTPIAMIFSVVASWGVLLSRALVDELPAELRDEANLILAQFYGGYVADLAAAAEQARAR